MSDRKDHLWKVAQEAEERIDDLVTTNPYGVCLLYTSPSPRDS